jgi:hypothetical protein
MWQSSRQLGRRIAGLLLMVLGGLALSAPLSAGRWSLAVLGVPLILLSIGEAYAVFSSPQRAEARRYVPSLLAMLAGNVLLLSSALLLNGLLILFVAILAVGEISEKSRTQPSLHVQISRVIPISTTFGTPPIKPILMTGKRSAGEDQREPLLRVRNVGNDTIDPGIGSSDEGLLQKSDASIIEDPRSLVFVG